MGGQREEEEEEEGVLICRAAVPKPERETGGRPACSLPRSLFTTTNNAYLSRRKRTNERTLFGETFSSFLFFFTREQM